MAEMIAEVYDALRSIGIAEDKAKQAATALTGMKDESWKRTVEVRFERIDGTLRLHSWMLATVLAMLTAILFKVFS
jgi:hypothetical protein